MKQRFSCLFRYLWLNQSIFYLSLIVSCVVAFMPTEGTVQENMNDKLAHCGSFFILSLLLHLAYPKTRLLFIFVYMAMFGIGIEIVQAYLPYRSFEWLDWGADMLGIILYLVCVTLVQRKLGEGNRLV